jgi:hypothetical protein
LHGEVLKLTRRQIVLTLLGLVSHAALFGAGYVSSQQRSRAEVGERALGNFMQGLAALAYLEKGNTDGARNSLRVMLDGDLVTMSTYSTPAFDAYSAEKNPKAKQKLMVQYDDIRKKYPSVEYGDAGAMNRNVDELLASARKSLVK